MISKCAKFHTDISSRYRVKFIPASGTELWETANFVYKFVQKTNASTQLWWQIWSTFPLNFLCSFHTRFLSTFSMDPFQVWLPAMATHTKSIAGGHWWAKENLITAHDLKSVYTMMQVGRTRSWTEDLLICSQMLYHWAIRPLQKWTLQQRIRHREGFNREPLAQESWVYPPEPSACRQGRKHHSVQDAWQQKIDSPPLSFQVSFPVPGSASLQLVEVKVFPSACQRRSHLQ